MNSQKLTLRVLVLADLVLVAIVVTLSFVMEQHLPAPLQDYLILEAEQELTAIELLVLCTGLLLLVAYAVSAVGLLFIQRWAFYLYTSVLACGTILTLLMGPTVEHAVTTMFDYFSSMLEGLIIAYCIWNWPATEETGGIDSPAISGNENT